MSHAKHSQPHRILKLLKRNGSATNVRLNSMGIFRYSAVIHVLRQEGHIIESVRIRDGLWSFRYKGHREDA